MEDGARGTKAVSPGIILISSIRLYLPAALPVPGRADIVLDQGGGAIRAVSPLLDSLRCRVLGGRKTHMGKRQRADSLRLRQPSTWRYWRFTFKPQTSHIQCTLPTCQ